jgi:hypothetical protein
MYLWMEWVSRFVGNFGIILIRQINSERGYLSPLPFFFLFFLF